MMADYEGCKFYTKEGNCAHRDAPKPYKSHCIGKAYCGAWEDEIEEQALAKAEG